jgi:ABC-type amino acid transport/signal transduction systems, periplasmic component/domain
VTVKYYPNLDETWNAVRNGEVDATVFTSNAYDEYGWNCICSFGKKPTYIAVAKNREELLSALNDATNLIDVDNPAYLGDLYAQYFKDNPMRRSLSPEEIKWIDEHPVIHVGGFVNDAPYLYSVDNETRTATGLTVDVISGIIERLNLPATADYKGYSSLQEMEDALDSGEIDVIIPFYPSHNIAKEHNLVFSNTVRVSNMEIVYKKNISYKDAVEKIATPSTKLGIYYVRDTFPKSEIVGAVSIQDAVDMVQDGRATGAVAQNVVLS